MDRVDHRPAANAQPTSPSPRHGARSRRSRTAALLVLPALLAVSCGLQAAPTGHAVSGRVTGEVAAGVAITLTGGATPLTTTTGAAGTYAFGSLANGTYQVTPTLAGYVFAPNPAAPVTVANADVTGQDFVATATHHAVRGTIRGVVTAGVELRLTGPSTATATSAADGTFAFPALLDSTYVLTPRLAGYGFSPGARQVTLSGADAAGQDFASSVLTTPLHAITGTVAGAVAAGVTVTLEGGGATLATTVTDAAGAFRFAALADATYTVTPSLTGYSFAPHAQSVTLGGADTALPGFLATATAGSSQVEELSTGGRLAYGIALGNDLNAWITDGASPVVSRVRLQDSVDGARGEVTDFPVGAADATPTAIALRFFGLRCFTEPLANRIGCMSWAGTEVFTVDIPTQASGPVDIVNGPGASQLSPDLWFAEHDAGKVGRMRVADGPNPASGAMVGEYVLPAGCKPTALAWSSGNVWWAAEGCGRIGFIDPVSGAVQAVPVDVGQPVSLAPILDELGVWFVDAASDRLGRLTAAGALAWFAPAVPGSKLTGVANGPDKAVYVTQLAANSIARLPFSSFDPRADPNSGRLAQEFALPTAGSQPFRITGGTDGNLWFTERGQPRIGVINMPTHCLSGKVTLADLATPVAAVLLTLTPAGGGAGTALTTAEGTYGFCGLAPGAYTVTPSLAAKTFVPASLPVTMGTSNLVDRSFVAQ